jgi:hypothetical protein
VYKYGSGLGAGIGGIGGIGSGYPKPDVSPYQVSYQQNAQGEQGSIGSSNSRMKNEQY